MFSKKRLFVAIAISVVVVIFAYLNFGKSSRVKEVWSYGWSKPQDGIFSKNFTAQENWRGKIVELDFSTLSGAYEIHMNGILIKKGDTENGVCVDVAPYLKFDSPNTIAVKASQNASLREVILVAKNPISIAHNGIKVDAISKNRIGIRAEIKNASDSKEKVDVYFVVKNGDGKVVAKKDITLPIHQKSLSGCSVVLPSENLNVSGNKVEVSIVQFYKVLDSDWLNF